MIERHLLISVHDVTPAHAAQLDRVFALLAEFDVRQVALLVVPDWHGAWPLAQAGAFTDRLRALREDGAEMLLHGLRHDERLAKRSSCPSRRSRRPCGWTRDSRFLPPKDWTRLDSSHQPGSTGRVSLMS